MRILIFSAVAMLLCAGEVSAQVQKPSPRRVSPPETSRTKPASLPPAAFDLGKISGHTYTNSTFGFTITFPDSWFIQSQDFESYSKSKGIDLSLKPPKAANAAVQRRLDADFKRLTVLLTAYRALPGTADNAAVHIAVEDVRKLTTSRPVKDAVDYIDLVRSTYKPGQMPSDFWFSETQAEKLGRHQFAYIDTSNKEGRSRLYATIRDGHAVLFRLSYATGDDLQTFRDILAKADFNLK